MQGTVVYEYRHCPYMSKKQLGWELGYKETTIGKLCKGLQSEIGKRYSPYVVADNRYNFFAMVDYLKWRPLLEDESKRKDVPPFDPDEVARVCGHGARRILCD